MSKGNLYTVTCCSCGEKQFKTYGCDGLFIKCSNCKAELYIEVDQYGIRVDLTKQPKMNPAPPVIPREGDGFKH